VQAEVPQPTENNTEDLEIAADALFGLAHNQSQSTITPTVQQPSTQIQQNPPQITETSGAAEIVTYFSNAANSIPDLNLIDLFRDLKIGDIRKIIKGRKLETKETSKTKLKNALIESMSPATSNDTVTTRNSQEEIVLYLSDDKHQIPNNLQLLLENLNKDNLCIIAKARGVIYAKLTKKNLVKKIMEALDPTKQNADAIRNWMSLEERKQTIFNVGIDGKQHDEYKDHFNGVDLINRRFYEGVGKFRITNWRLKMLSCIMSLALINSHTLHFEIKKGKDASNFKQFKRDLVMKMLKLQDKEAILDHIVRKVDLKKKNDNEEKE